MKGAPRSRSPHLVKLRAACGRVLSSLSQYSVAISIALLKMKLLFIALILLFSLLPIADSESLSRRRRRNKNWVRNLRGLVIPPFFVTQSIKAIGHLHCNKRFLPNVEVRLCDQDPTMNEMIINVSTTQNGSFNLFGEQNNIFGGFNPFLRIVHQCDVYEVAQKHGSCTQCHDTCFLYSDIWLDYNGGREEEVNLGFVNMNIKIVNETMRCATQIHREHYECEQTPLPRGACDEKQEDKDATTLDKLFC
ncbi:hypothetical protein L596_028871 [Steinernema carpocapsae]|uniref:Uncharacterized protein n=1 Tax=Steinernema carpocapsae TaxID=34508 RepID=A0A4V5ZY06_STECR|nr:hypothetical protein L596_028871 [Steinernema carpocapsae]